MEKMSREFDVDFTGFMKSLEALDGFSEIEHNSFIFEGNSWPN